MIHPNLPIPLAFYYRSNFLILPFLSTSCCAPWLPSPALSLFYPWAFFAISVSLYLALSPLNLCPPTVSIIISLRIHILVFIIPYLTDMAQEREWRVPGSKATRCNCRWHHRKTMTHGPLCLTTVISTCEDSLSFSSCNFHLELPHFFLAFCGKLQRWSVDYEEAHLSSSINLHTYIRTYMLILQTAHYMHTSCDIYFVIAKLHSFWVCLTNKPGDTLVSGYSIYTHLFFGGKIVPVTHAQFCDTQKSLLKHLTSLWTSM